MEKEKEKCDKWISEQRIGGIKEKQTKSRKLLPSEIHEIVKGMNIPYIDVSAYTGDNVTELFEMLVFEFYLFSCYGLVV